jgi:hypothetical protein
MSRLYFVKMNLNMADGPTTTEIKSPEQSLQTRIQNEAEQIVIAPNYRSEKGQLLVRPDGPVSLLPEQEWKMARTKAFKEWFGDWENPDKKNETSQIVDSNGEPVLAYHESPIIFEQFDEKFIGKTNDTGYYGRGFYFHSLEPGGLTGFYGGKEAKVATCFLNIKRPYLFTDQSGEFKLYYKWLLNGDKASALAKAKEMLGIDGYKARLKALEEGKIEKHRDIPQGVNFDEYWKKQLIQEKERIGRIIEGNTDFNSHLEEEYEELNKTYDGVVVANEGEKLDKTHAEIIAFKKEQVLISKWE